MTYKDKYANPDEKATEISHTEMAVHTNIHTLVVHSTLRDLSTVKVLTLEVKENLSTVAEVRVFLNKNGTVEILPLEIQGR